MSLSVGDAFIALNVDTAGLSRGIQQGERSVQQFGASTEKTVSGLSGHFKSLGTMVSGVFTGIGIGVAQKGLEALGGSFGALKSSVIDYNATLESSKTSWAVLLGGADAAQKKLDELSRFAATTPFEFPEVVKASQIMQTFGGDILNTNKNLTLIGNVAAGVGQPFEEVAMWTSRMYDAFQSGRPFGEASARLQEMGAMSGETRAKLEAMQAAGATGAELWDAFNASMGRFNANGGMMAQLANTWNGRLGTLHDTLNSLAATAGRPIFDKLSAGLGKLVDGLSTDKAATFATTIGTKVGAALDYTFTKIGQGVSIARDLWDTFTKITGAGGHLLDAFRGGDFNQAFGPILDAVDAAFGDKARDKVVLFVSDALSGFQTVRDTVLTIGQAWSGQWQDSDKISSPFVRAAGDITQVLSDSFKTAKLAFSGNWVDSDQISNPFVRGVGIVATEFGKLPDQLRGLWTMIADQVGPALAPIGTTIQDAITGFTQGSATGGLINLGNMILGPDGGAQVATAIQNVQNALNPLIDAIKNFNYSGTFATIAKDLGDFWTQLQPLTGGITSLYLALSPTGAALSTITGEFNVWTSLAQTLGPILTNTLGAAFLGIQGALGPIGAQFAQLGAVAAEQGPQLASIGTSLMNLWTALKPIFEAVAAVIGTVLVIALGELVSMIGGVVGAIAGALPGALLLFQGAIDTLTGTIKFLTDLFTGFVNVFVDLIHGDWSGALDDMRGMGTKLLGDLTLTFTGLKEMVIGAVTGLIGGTLGLLDGFVTTAVGFFGTLFTRITGQQLPAFVTDFEAGVTHLRDDTLGTIGGWMSNLGTSIQNGLDAIKTTLNNWSDEMARKLNTWSDNIASLLMSPFEKARDAIGGVIGAFRTALIGPLQSALNSMGAFGGGIAGVINWIANALKLNISIGTPPVPQLASGTADFKGGPAVVGEEGPELVYLPKHAIVVPHDMTAMMLRTGLVPGFAGGLNLPNLGDIIKGGPSWLIDRALAAVGVPLPTLPGVLAQGGKAIFDQVKVWLGDAVTKFVNDALPVNAKNIKAMQDFVAAHVGEPYTWGGGHGAPGFDCSGWVAAVLDAGGIPNPHSIVTGFYEWMADGRTGVVDIGVNDPYAAPDVQHTGIGVMGQWSEAGGRAGGVGYTADYFSSVGHPPIFNNLNDAKSPGSLDFIDWEQSLKNYNSGGKGQWTRFATGGVLGEPVTGMGVSGRRYSFGETGAEIITPIRELSDLADVLVGAIAAAAKLIVEAIRQGGTLGGVSGGTTPAPAPAPAPPAGTTARPDQVGPLPPPKTDAGATKPGGMIGHFPEPVLPDPGHPGWWVGVNTGTVYDADGKPVKTSGEWGPRTPLPPTPQVPAGAAHPGMIGHFPEPVMPHPGHPGWFVGVLTGNVYDADGNVVKSAVANLPGGPRPTTPSGQPEPTLTMYSMMAGALGGPGPWDRNPIPLPGTGAPGGMIGHFPEPVAPHPGHPGWWVGTKTGTVYDASGNPVPASDWGPRTTYTPPGPGAPGAPGGMIGHFPEPVAPHPGHPGWWVGTKTGTVYDGDGHPVNPTGGEWGPRTPYTPPTPALPGAPTGMIGHFPEPVRPHPGHPGWFVGVNTNTVYDSDGHPVNPTGVPAPAGPTTGGGTPATAPATPTTGTGKGQPATLVLEIRETFEMPDGKIISHTIVTDPIAIEELAAGVTGIQAREKDRITQNRATASGGGAFKVR